jgi:hypothetical protein
MSEQTEAQRLADRLDLYATGDKHQKDIEDAAAELRRRHQSKGASMSTTDKLTKALSDSIPLGPHSEPHAEWIKVRLDFVQKAIDHMDWLEKGNDEWRRLGLSYQKQARASQATARIAIGHLQEMLNKARTATESYAADTAARDWLESIGSDPQ